MSQRNAASQDIVPAHLDFLAIFNPGLGPTEDTEKDQIVFYYAKPARKTRRKKAQDDRNPGQEQAEENERMRQIGLAQGMVNFARTFGGGQDVDSIETVKHRIILKELEKDWWILASINLTRLPSTSHSSLPDSSPFEYSAREISPPALLLQQLQRAHRVFLLHQSQSLQDLYQRLSREKTCVLLEKYWTRFSREWDVLLHGNPATDAYDATKLAAAGELGVGVGEEEWGSGEREVLEGLMRTTEGLVDLTVSRFGPDHAPAPNDSKRKDVAHGSQAQSLFTPTDTSQPTDGLIFAGQGSISKESLHAISDWTQHIYLAGEDAYGVRDNPSSTRPNAGTKRSNGWTPPKLPVEPSSSDIKDDDPGQASAKPSESRPPAISRPSIPPPILSAAEQSLQKTSANHASATADTSRATGRPKSESYISLNGEKWASYLTLGYGTKWGGSASKDDGSDAAKAANVDSSDDKSQIRDKSSQKTTASDAVRDSTRPTNTRQTSRGQFVIGLTGALNNDNHSEERESDDEWNSRLYVRTVHVHVQKRTTVESNSAAPRHNSDYEAPIAPGPQKLRVVVYVDPPFIYTFLFQPATSSLSLPEFYQTLHRNLQPLHKPLLASTSAKHLETRLRSGVPSASNANNALYDLVYDPASGTVRTSIPSIPGLAPPPTSPRESSATTKTPWTRLEALNVHSQILATISETRGNITARERSAKTSRNWWVVWMRLPGAKQKREGNDNDDSRDDYDNDVTETRKYYREVLLIRRSNDTSSTHGSNSTSGFRRFSLGSGGVSGMGRLMSRDPGTGSGSDENGPGGGWGPSRLVEGMGIDPRRYVETLLNLNR